MEEKTKPYERRKGDYLYIPYWIIKLEQIVDEVREGKTQKYYKNRDI